MIVRRILLTNYFSGSLNESIKQNEFNNDTIENTGRINHMDDNRPKNSNNAV